MHVVFIHGPAAAGKFTIGKELSEHTGLPLFHNHLTVDLALTLFDFGSVHFNALRATIWRAAFAEAAKAGRSFIFTFNPEATVEPALIDEMIATVEAAGGTVFFVELTCPHEALIQRMGTEQRAKFGKLTDPELYQKVLSEGGFDFPPLPEPLISLETAGLSPQEAARAVERALTAALTGSGRLPSRSSH